VTRANPSPLLVPALPEPLGEVLDEFTLRAGTAHSYTVAKGQYVQVLDVAGRQCSDFVALDRRALDRGVELDLDQTVTRTLNGSAYPAPGLFSKFFDRQMQPMLEVVQDTVGRHDAFALACAARYYEAMAISGTTTAATTSAAYSRPWRARRATAGRRSISSSTPGSTRTSR
jgi:aminomethyltransferase